ncbi:MAG: histidine kinase dimerization/phospho-acceptor domain-containing protein, partial [Candidatus Zixiibacteriota bacterium]
MNLSRRTVGVVITLMVVSLGGLVSLQVYLLKLAMEQKEQIFRRNVFAAMNTVSQRLEKTEAFTFAFGSTGRTEANWQVNVSSLRPPLHDSIQIQGMFIEGNGPFGANFAEPPISVVDGILRYEITNPQHVMIKMYDQAQGTDHVVVDTFRAAGKYEVDLKGMPVSESRMMYMFRTDSNSAIFEMQNGSHLTSLVPMMARTNKEDYVKRVVTDLVVAELEPIEERITQKELDTLISSALGESGINLAFAYGVFSGANDSLRLVSAMPAREQLRKSEFRTRLFPNDMLSARSDLALHFPDRAVYLWKQMGVLVMTNLLFIGVIVAVFIYTLRVMLAQQRFSGRIVDFINNMTHEFKTPISTVALACEAIMRPDVIEQPERIGKYGRMILDENQRMRH